MRIKKSKLFVSIFLVTVTFLAFQILFVNYMKALYSNSGENNENEHFENPRFAVLKPKTTPDELIEIEPSFDFDTNDNTTYNTTNYHIELLVPLQKTDNQPPLVYLLPFHHKKNFFEFKTVYVGDKFYPSSKTKIELPINSQESKIFRGVNKIKLDLYKPDDDGMFKCLNSNQKIPHIRLNDDFCDCVDATDEPGTSACQFSIFYCSTQNEYLLDNFIPSSRVDDKICDCCDGSDENDVLIKCPNHCGVMIERAKEVLQIKIKAQSEKRKYLVDGIFKNENLYGPKGVFYKLSLKCLTIKWAEFTYEVCPYKRVTQFKSYDMGRKTDIGTDSALVLGEISNKKVWILKMGNGNREFCSQPRESEIRFQCGIEDQLKSVQEPQKCVYVFELQTPAAC